MQNHAILRTLLWITVVVVTASCSKKEETLPDTPPVIEFRSITKTTLGIGNNKRDSVVITIIFKDGDGNLGESDTTRIKQIYSNQSWGNFKVDAFQLVNGKFLELPIASNSKLIFAYLGQKNKFIDGPMSFSQRFFYLPNFKITPVKFQIKIRDQNLNESNVIETDTVNIPIT
jgi:hypothetical protein